MANNIEFRFSTVESTDGNQQEKEGLIFLDNDTDTSLLVNTKDVRWVFPQRNNATQKNCVSLYTCRSPTKAKYLPILLTVHENSSRLTDTGPPESTLYMQTNI